MITAEIEEVERHLSSYTDPVENGEVIVVCRDNRPVAELPDC